MYCQLSLPAMALALVRRSSSAGAIGHVEMRVSVPRAFYSQNVGLFSHVPPGQRTTGLATIRLPSDCLIGVLPEASRV